MKLIKTISLRNYIDKNLPDFYNTYANTAGSDARKTLCQNTFNKLKIRFKDINTNKDYLIDFTKPLNIVGVGVLGTTSITQLLIQKDTGNINVPVSALKITDKVTKDDILARIEQLENLKEINRFLTDTETYDYDYNQFVIYKVIKQAGKNIDPLKLSKEISEAINSPEEEVEL